MPTPTLWNRSFVLLWAGTFLAFFAAFQLFPGAPLRLRQLGADLSESGLFLSIFTIGSSLGALLTGQLGDRLGHRRMMVATSTGFMLLMAAYAFIPVRWGFYVLAPVQGAIWSGLLTSNSALLGGLLPAERRVEGMSFFGLASPAGVVLGPTAGVWMFQHVGWKGLCLGLVLCFAAHALVVRSLPADPPSAKERPPFQWPDWPVLRLASVLFFVALGYGALSSFSTQEALWLHFAWPSAFLSCLALGMVLARLGMGALGFGRDPVRRLPAMLLLATLGLAVLAFAPGGQARHIVAALLYGAGYSMVFTLLNTEVLETVPAQRRGAAFGTFMFAFDAGIGLGSYCLGALMGRFGFQWGWRAGALAMLGALPIAVRIARRSASESTAPPPAAAA
jgi:MFS family permease